CKTGGRFCRRRWRLARGGDWTGTRRRHPCNCARLSTCGGQCSTTNSTGAARTSRSPPCSSTWNSRTSISACVWRRFSSPLTTRGPSRLQSSCHRSLGTRRILCTGPPWGAPRTTHRLTASLRHRYGFP
ncbi:unnamed protein product, partial [Ectocarpus sp. 8 AP-2014]